MASSNRPKINKHPDAGVQVQVQVQGPRSRCSWPKIAQGKGDLEAAPWKPPRAEDAQRSSTSRRGMNGCHLFPVPSNTTTHTCDKCDTCPLLSLFKFNSPVPTLFQRHSLPQLQNNLRHLLSITTTPSPSAVGEAVRIDLASLFSSCYNLSPDHRPPSSPRITRPK